MAEQQQLRLKDIATDVTAVKCAVETFVGTDGQRPSKHYFEEFYDRQGAYIVKAIVTYRFTDDDVNHADSGVDSGNQPTTTVSTVSG